MIEVFNKKINPILDFTIPNDLAKEIKKFAKLNYKNRDLFKFNGHGRQYCNLNLHDLEISKKIKLFHKECMQKLNIKKYYPEDIYGNFIGVIALKGTHVHVHSDPKDDKGNVHFRLLFMIQNAQKCGEPILKGTKIKIKNNQGWTNFASEWEHSCSPVSGKTLRIIVSMGAYVPKEEFKTWIK